MENLSQYSFYLLIFAVILLFYLYRLYVNLITKKNKVYEALGTMDAQLTQRHDLIPNILIIAKKFMEHEEKVFTTITELRENVIKDYDRNDANQVAEHLQKENTLHQQMAQLMMRVENYPTLKSDQTMLQTMQTYNEVEANIAAARRFYNASVASLNTDIEIFPGSLIANLIHLKSMPFYKADESVKAPIKASDYL